MVTVSERVCLFPTCTVPKSRLVGFDPKAPAATPRPNRGIVKEGFEASDPMVKVPITLPAASGWKAILKVVLCEGLSVSGGEIPLI